MQSNCHAQGAAHLLILDVWRLEIGEECAHFLPVDLQFVQFPVAVDRHKPAQLSALRTDRRCEGGGRDGSGRCYLHVLTKCSLGYFCDRHSLGRLEDESKCK